MSDYVIHAVQYGKRGTLRPKTYYFRHTEALAPDTYVLVPYLESNVVNQEDAIGYTVARIVAVVDAAEKIENWIVDVVDDSKYLARIEAEKRAVLIRKDLKRRLAEINEERKYEVLRSDAVASKLLDELKELGVPDTLES